MPDINERFLYAMIHRLDWDSDFFGLRIAKVEVTTQNEVDLLQDQYVSLKNEFDLIYVFAQNQILLTAGRPQLVDQKVVYTTSILGSCNSDSHIVEYIQKTVSEDLLNLALASGLYSRFRIDRYFPKNSYERLYTRWIEQSVAHKIASEVFCYMVDEIPRGLVTLRRDGVTGDIGLVATDEKYRGLGIGKAMMNYVKDYMFYCGCKKLSVATQLHNIAACNLYESAGFHKESLTNIWHWWLNK